ncbi:MAG: phosphoadenosine phosphosulfate reductase family protein [Defluviitaleaceae bacterium]|nr:phosphoadenosine phosphosulfate reductase family protein [Defluviitaleaceae bacterium]
MIIKKAIQRIQSAYKMAEHSGNILIVADSGGKDSSVLIDLAVKANVPLCVQHNHTTVDAPETVYFIRENHARLEAQGIICKINPPEISMWNLIVKKLMPPLRHIRYCCEHLKERKFDNQHLLLGVRWAESNNRKSRGIHEELSPKVKNRRVCMEDDTPEIRTWFENCINHNRIVTNPIIDWSNREIWEYIRRNNIRVNPLYECGFHRVGCVGCPMSTKARYELERYPKIKASYIRAFDRMIEERKRKGLNRTTSWQDGESVYKWWTNPGYDPETEKMLLTIEDVMS